MLINRQETQPDCQWSPSSRAPSAAACNTAGTRYCSQACTCLFADHRIHSLSDSWCPGRTAGPRTDWPPNARWRTWAHPWTICLRRSLRQSTDSGRCGWGPRLSSCRWWPGSGGSGGCCSGCEVVSPAARYLASWRSRWRYKRCYWLLNVWNAWQRLVCFECVEAFGACGTSKQVRVSYQLEFGLFWRCLNKL